MPNRHPIQRITLVLSLLAGASLLPAQEAKDGDVFELSPFEVNTTKDVGYIATNTLAGSRLNVALKDTPAPISVFTKDFLDDIGANDVVAATQYSMNFERDTTNRTGNFDQERDVNIKARNLATSTGARRVSRNYFVWFINGDTYNTEQLSFSRGPNSILFGIGEAGGSINSMTKRAYTDRSFLVTGFKADDEGTFRWTNDYNAALGKRAALRVNTLWQDGDSWKKYAYKDQLRFSLAGTWEVNKDTTVRYDGEYGEIDQMIAQRHAGWDRYSGWTEAGSLPYDKFTMSTPPAGVSRYSAVRPALVWTAEQGFSNWQGMGISSLPAILEKQISDFTVLPRNSNLTGPGGTSDNSFYTQTLFLEHRIGDDLAFELAYNIQRDERDMEQPLIWDNIALKVDPNLTLPDGSQNPNFGKFFTEYPYSRSFQERDIRILRATGSYKLDLGKAGLHRLVGMYSKETVDTERESFRETNLTPFGPSKLYADSVINRRTYLDFAAGIDSHLSPKDTPLSVTPFSDPVNNVSGTITPGMYQTGGSITEDILDSFLLATQSSFMDDRLTFTLGYRKDNLDNRLSKPATDKVTGEVIEIVPNPEPVAYAGTTKSIGLVFDIIDSVAVFGNMSDNFNPQNYETFREGNVGNLKGEGWDAGFKFSFLDNRIYATAGYYSTDVVNQRQTMSGNYIGWMRDIARTIDGAPDGPNWIESNGDTKDVVGDGWEFEVTTNITKHWRLMANFAISQTKVSNVWPRHAAYIEENRALWNQYADQYLLNSSTYTVGDRIEQLDTLLSNDKLEEGNEGLTNRKYKANMYTNYTFSEGWLEGVDLGVGLQWRDKAVIGYTTSRDIIHGNSYYLVNAAVGYKTMLWRDRVEMKLRLFIDNVLDEDELILEGSHPNGTLRYYQFIDPRKIGLSATFEF